MTRCCLELKLPNDKEPGLPSVPRSVSPPPIPPPDAAVCMSHAARWLAAYRRRRGEARQERRGRLCFGRRDSDTHTHTDAFRCKNALVQAQIFTLILWPATCLR